MRHRTPSGRSSFSSSGLARSLHQAGLSAYHDSDWAGAARLWTAQLEGLFDTGYRAALRGGNAVDLAALLEHGRTAALRESLGSRSGLESAVIPRQLRKANHWAAWVLWGLAD